jgi:heme/copper-type cytochrome/quinol oxidase subunit 2
MGTIIGIVVFAIILFFIVGVLYNDDNDSPKEVGTKVFILLLIKVVPILIAIGIGALLFKACS